MVIKSAISVFFCRVLYCIRSLVLYTIEDSTRAREKPVFIIPTDLYLRIVYFLEVVSRSLWL
jgi:hypothetical protein